ncbi:MAG TPA: S-methyl-5-thioribose-1-phosphate isomerase, partial [Candidatus Limnocylindria bacterium]
MNVNGTHYRTVWMEGSAVRMIDQRWLPHRFTVVDLQAVAGTCTAIRDMWVRGAGAIGATAGYGMAQAALLADGDDWREQVAQAAAALCATRPTAHNLFYAVERVAAAIDGSADLGEAQERAVAETCTAIRDMWVRGAGAIGATAGYGMAQAALLADGDDWREQVA